MRITNGRNVPVDFCKDCEPTEESALFIFGDGEGPDGRGNCFAYDVDHPTYNMDFYRCEVCDCVLDEND